MFVLVLLTSKARMYSAQPKTSSVKSRTCCSADVHEERKDVSLTAERRPEAIHLYGVDLMSTNDIMQYFADYLPSYVEWINDSSCELQLGSAGYW